MASLKKDTYFVVSSRIISTLLGFIASIFLVRLLGTEGNGIFSKINAAGSLLITITLFNIYPGITYFTANKKIPEAKTLAMSLVFAFGAMALSGLAYLFFQVIGMPEFLLPKGHQSKFYIAYLFLFIGLSLATGIFRSFLHGRTQFRELYFTTIINSVLKLLLFAGAFYYTTYALITFTVENGLGLSLLLSLIAALVAAWFFRKIFPGINPDFSFKFRKEFKTFYTYNLLAYLMIIANFLLAKIDIWFIEYYTSLEELGLYALAVSLSNLLLNITTTLRSILFPYLVKGNRAENIRLLKLFSRINFTLITLAVIGGIVTGPVLIPLLYGSSFSGSILPFQILLASTCFMGLRNIFTIYNLAHDKSKYNIWSNVFALFCIIILDFILIPKYGITGAATASLIAYLLGMTTTMFSVFYFHKIPFGNYFLPGKEDFQKVKNMFKK